MADRLTEVFERVHLADQVLHRLQQNVGRSLDALNGLVQQQSNAALLSGRSPAWLTALLDAKLDAADLTAAAVLALLLGVDGTGSLLDADLLDGAEGSAYQTVAGLLTAILAVDGAGSLLDADLLDAQHGAYYRDMDNANAGTLAVGRGGTGATGFGTSALVQATAGGLLATLASPSLTQMAFVDFTSSGQTQLDGKVPETDLAMRVRSLCWASKTSDQSINHGTGTDIDFDGTDNYDPDGWHSGSPADEFVPPSGQGITHVLALGQVAFADNVTGYRAVSLTVGGSFAATGRPATILPATTGLPTFVPMLGMVAVTAGTSILVVSAQQSSGGALNVQGNATRNATNLLLLGLELE